MLVTGYMRVSMGLGLGTVYQDIADSLDEGATTDAIVIDF